MAPRVTRDTICIGSEDVVARLIEGDLIIVPLTAGIGDADDELYTLNETGKAVWQTLDGKRHWARWPIFWRGNFPPRPKRSVPMCWGFAPKWSGGGFWRSRSDAFVKSHFFHRRDTEGKELTNLNFMFYSVAESLF